MIARDAVIGRVEPVAMFHCLLLRIVAIELLFQYDAVIDCIAVTGMVEPVTSLFWNVLETHELIELLFQYEAVIDCDAVTGMVEPVTSLFWNVLETHELIELLSQYDAVLAYSEKYAQEADPAVANALEMKLAVNAQEADNA